MTSDPKLPLILANSTEIHQTIVNLGTNAIHAIEGQKGWIHINIERMEIDGLMVRHLPALHQGTYVCISFKDSGCGMSHETISRIYEPFFTTKALGQGSGLGLSVVHGIVEGHGGALFANSSPGKGTEFRVYLPATSKQPEIKTIVPMFKSDGTGRQVMVVDDEEALVFVLDKTLSRMGYKVSGFSRPEDALAAFNKSPGGYDLVLMDFAMPGLTGLELSTQLLAIRPNLPIILATGFAKPEMMATARTIGICELILKPDLIEEIEGAILRHLPWQDEHRLPN